MKNKKRKQQKGQNLVTRLSEHKTMLSLIESEPEYIESLMQGYTDYLSDKDGYKEIPANDIFEMVFAGMMVYTTTPDERVQYLNMMVSSIRRGQVPDRLGDAVPAMVDVVWTEREEYPFPRQVAGNLIIAGFEMMGQTYDTMKSQMRFH